MYNVQVFFKKIPQGSSAYVRYHWWNISGEVAWMNNDQRRQGVLKTKCFEPHQKRVQLSFYLGGLLLPWKTHKPPKMLLWGMRGTLQRNMGCSGSKEPPKSEAIPVIRHVGCHPLPLKMYFPFVFKSSYFTIFMACHWNGCYIPDHGSVQYYKSTARKQLTIQVKKNPRTGNNTKKHDSIPRIKHHGGWLKAPL